MSSPTQRSLNLLREQGYMCCVVEKFNHHIKRRIDAFGFGDILAIRGNLTMLVQTTDGTSVSKRIAKILTLPEAATWIASPTRELVVHGWSKKGPRSARKTWQVRIEHIGPLDGWNLPNPKCHKDVKVRE